MRRTRRLPRPVAADCAALGATARAQHGAGEYSGRVREMVARKQRRLVVDVNDLRAFDAELVKRRVATRGPPGAVRRPNANLLAPVRPGVTTAPPAHPPAPGCSPPRPTTCRRSRRAWRRWCAPPSPSIWRRASAASWASPAGATRPNGAPAGSGSSSDRGAMRSPRRGPLTAARAAPPPLPPSLPPPSRPPPPAARSFGFNRVTPRALLSAFLGQMVQVEGIVTKCARAPPGRPAAL